MILQLYMPQFDDTSYVILQRGLDGLNHNAVSYLESGHTYQVEVGSLAIVVECKQFSLQVTGVNSAGSGTPSEQITFTINGRNIFLS